MRWIVLLLLVPVVSFSQTEIKPGIGVEINEEGEIVPVPGEVIEFPPQKK